MKNESWILSQTLAGSGLFNFFRLLKQARYAVAPKYYFRFLVILASILLLTPLALLEQWRFRRQIAQHQAQTDPIFILGHWRSGTTFLHTLLAQDTQWAYMSTFQAMLNRVAVLGKRFLKPLLQMTLPTKRPMDDMPLHMDYPQEEEFAMTNHQGLSFYLMLHFPRQLGFYFDQYLTFSGASPEIYAAWKKSYQRIIQKTSWLNGGKTLVLKNPPNTARIAALLELYPNAKFIYLYRDPYELYFSTRRSVYEMMKVFELHSISEEQIAQHVLAMYPKMMEAFLEQQPAIPPQNFCCLSYQQLKSDPQQALAFIYQRLQLPGLASAQPGFAAHLNTVQAYRAAAYKIEPHERAKIDAAWGTVLARHEAWLQHLGAARMGSEAFEQACFKTR